MAEASGGQAGEQPVRRALRSGSGIACHRRDTRAVRSTCPAQHHDVPATRAPEERYGDHDGYVRAVTAAANHAVDMGFLLPADRDALIAQAQASTVLNP
jgi:Alpha/beta hydrolase domain